jgi:hypothetical protein
LAKKAYVNDGTNWVELASATTDLTAYQQKVTGVSNTEIGYLDGVTSAIQTQLDAKLASSTASSTYLTQASASTTYATQTDFPAGAWQSYTPVWGSNGTQPTLNNGTISGSYTRIGKTIHYRIQMTIGSTSSLGTGTRYTFTLPSTNKNLYPMATGFYFDTSTNTWYSVWGRTTTTAVDTLWVAAGPNGLTGGTLGAANPVVPASGDIYFMNGTYEEA